jgi:hypothetical protein
VQLAVIRQNPLNSAALALLVLLTLLALVRPIIGYDGWWYHLPFSSYLWNIGGGASSFRLGPFLTERWLGFPKLWEFIQGFFWYATGSINATVVPHMLLFGLYVAYVCRKVRVPIGYVILAFFASPMLLIHYECTHLDLAAGIAVALAFLVLTDLVLDAGTEAPWRPWPRGLAAIALFALAGNIKYQGLLACFAVSAVIGVGCLGLCRMVLARRCALFGILVVANLAAGAWAIRNTAHFDNPFYPLRVVVAGKTIFPGPEDPDDPSRDSPPPRYVLYGNSSTRFPGPIDFILSASELDWTMRGVVPWYDIGSVTGNNPARGGPARTGGWGGLFVLVNAWLLGMQLLRLHRLDDARQRLLALNAALLVAVTAFLPRAYELRYWLFLPLVLIPVNMRFLCQWDRDAKFAPHLLSAMLLYGMAIAALSPKSGLLEPHLESQQQRARDMPPEVRHALMTTGRYCNADNNLIFRYSTAATGIAGIVSHDPRDCP